MKLFKFILGLLFIPTIACAQIHLRWNDTSNNEQGFNIYRSENGIDFHKIGQTLKNIYRFSDSDVESSKFYYYYITAFNLSNAESLKTNILKTSYNGKLINISTRGYVGINDNVLIGGFVLDKSSKVLIRGVGPTLSTWLQGTISDPKIEIVRNNITLLENDNWNDNPEIIKVSDQVGAFQLKSGSKDAAIVTTLEQGAYTVIVRGVNNVEGIGLVEIYEVK